MKLDGAWTLYYAPESDDMPMCPDQIAGSGMACITAVCAVPLGKIKRIVPFFGFDPFYFCGEGVSL